MAGRVLRGCAASTGQYRFAAGPLTVVSSPCYICAMCSGIRPDPTGLHLGVHDS